MPSIIQFLYDTATPPAHPRPDSLPMSLDILVTRNSSGVWPASLVGLRGACSWPAGHDFVRCRDMRPSGWPGWPWQPAVCCRLRGRRGTAQQTPPGNRPAQAVAFDEYFLAQTMRVDYYHSGNAQEDRIALERVVSDGVWAGGRTRLTDTLDLGLYCFEVRDQQSQQLLYARGFCSVFGEWQTTAPAKQQWGTFHESLRFPWPRQPVDVVIKRRHEGGWRELWTATIDPNSRFVVNADPPASGNVWTVFENGPTAEKVDLLFLGDGYTSAEVEKFHADTQRLVERLFAVEPFQSRRTDFNVRAIDVSSGQSGIAQPRDGIFRRSAFSCQYDTFDLERYVLTADNRTLRDIASAAPVRQSDHPAEQQEVRRGRDLQRSDDRRRRLHGGRLHHRA